MKIEIRHYTEAKRFDSINDGSIIEIKNTGNIDPEVADMQRAVYEMVTGMAPLQRINTGHLKPGCNHPNTEAEAIPVNDEIHCDHDNYTEEAGEPYVICDTCHATGTLVDDWSDDGWDGEKRQYTLTKTIEWE